MDRPNVFTRISTALSSLGKRKAPEDADAGTYETGHSPKHRASLSFRPWDQRDLHRRLLTFRPLTWFAKPESVGAVACAKRGWCNTARDTLVCEVCSATIIYPSSSMPYEHRRHAVAMFSEQLVSKHTTHCPWRTTCCEDSTLMFKKPDCSEKEEAYERFRHRLQSLMRVDELPDLESSSVALLTSSSCSGKGGRTLKDFIWQAAEQQQYQAILQEIRRVAIAASEDANGRMDMAPSSASMHLTHSQRARLLSLLGWELESAVPGSTYNSGAAPTSTSASPGASAGKLTFPLPYYSLSHLLSTKAKQEGQQAGGSVGRAVTGPSSQHHINSVVLSCPLCHSRVGLWNYSGMASRPSVGRLRPSQPASLLTSQPSASVGGSLCTPTPGSGKTGAGTGGKEGATVSILDGTIAGGAYDVVGCRPVSRPHRFGAANPPPAFGKAASNPLLAQPQGATPRTPSPAAGASSSRTPLLRTGGEASTAKAMPTPSASAAVTAPLPWTSRAAASHVADKFDPVNLHRSWCPWIFMARSDADVQQQGMTLAAPSATAAPATPAPATPAPATPAPLTPARGVSSPAATPSSPSASKCGWMYLADELLSKETFEDPEQLLTPAQAQANGVADDATAVGYQTPSNIKKTLDGIKDMLRSL